MNSGLRAAEVFRNDVAFYCEEASSFLLEDLGREYPDPFQAIFDLSLWTMCFYQHGSAHAAVDPTVVLCPFDQLQFMVAIVTADWQPPDNWPFTLDEMRDAVHEVNGPLLRRVKLTLSREVLDAKEC